MSMSGWRFDSFLHNIQYMGKEGSVQREASANQESASAPLVLKISVTYCVVSVVA